MTTKVSSFTQWRSKGGDGAVRSGGKIEVVPKNLERETVF